MNKLLASIVMLLALGSCTNQAGKMPVSKPRPYFGDSLLSISFTCSIDTATNRELRDAQISELMTLGSRQDTTFIKMYRMLAPGSYKGACALKKDTLYLNYWLDSVDCGSPCMNMMAYKIRAKNITSEKLKTHFIYTGEAHKKYNN